MDGWEGVRICRRENRNYQMSDKQWLQRYVYIELHEIFFGDFFIIIVEWLERLVENTGRYRVANMRK
jgi:hypothetical protein